MVIVLRVSLRLSNMFETKPIKGLQRLALYIYRYVRTCGNICIRSFEDLRTSIYSGIYIYILHQYIYIYKMIHVDLYIYTHIYICMRTYLYMYRIAYTHIYIYI